MNVNESATVADDDAEAQRAADRLALALEETGFDVGRDFPFLQGHVDHTGASLVEVGRVTLPVAIRLADVLLTSRL